AQRAHLSSTYTGCELPQLTDSVKMTLYRFVQEALTNIVKHAQATEVQVILERPVDALLARVIDNGLGFQLEEQEEFLSQTSGIGLGGMQERLEIINGRLQIESTPGVGTQLTAFIPWSEEEE
ncbi:MAG: ATP-binding protein, partial [Candidatus Promineifilaceae bacterium]